MNKINWISDSFIKVGKHQVTCISNLTDGYNQESGIIATKKIKMFFKRAIWPFFKLYADCFIDGFIEREIGKYINKYITKESVFLEIGCGDMSLRKFVPSNLYYNAFDLRLSDFHVTRVLRSKRKINICLASATEIPVSANTASLIVSTEAFEHIPEIEKTIQEIKRVSLNKAILICSIPNNYCVKYIEKGPNIQHINNWTFDGFIKFMESYDLEFIEGFMKGKWIPFPQWLINISYQLPFSSKSEFYNTNFFYVFKINK